MVFITLGVGTKLDAVGFLYVLLTSAPESPLRFGTRQEGRAQCSVLTGSSEKSVL